MNVVRHWRAAFFFTVGDLGIMLLILRAVISQFHLLAYQKSEAAGKPCCDGSTFWAQAEKELLQQK